MIRCYPILNSFLFFGFFFFCFIEISIASEVSKNDFRSTYDLIMSWFNFAVILLVAAKYGYPPFKNYIQVQKKDIKTQIASLELKSKEAFLELEKAKQSKQIKKKNLENLKNNIILEGEKKYQEMIAEATKQSKIMLKDAQNKAKSRLKLAEKTIKNEIINVAINMAESKLNAYLNKDYHDYLFENYINKIGSQTK